MDKCVAEIKTIQKRARESDKPAQQPMWPMIVLITPKGWTGPKDIDGVVVEGTFRAHQVPIANCAKKESDLRALETWLKSYKPEELFTSEGKLKDELKTILPP